LRRSSDLVIRGFEYSKTCRQFHPQFMRAFLYEILAPKNFKPKTQLCNFWCQNFVQKGSSKMLMKLTPGVNVTTILHAAFLYESVLRSFSLLTVWLCEKRKLLSYF